MVGQLALSSKVTVPGEALPELCDFAIIFLGLFFSSLLSHPAVTKHTGELLGEKSDQIVQTHRSKSFNTYFQFTEATVLWLGVLLFLPTL